MANQGRIYKESDVSVPDIFGDVTRSAEKAIAKMEAVDSQIVKFTVHYKELLAITKTDTLSGLNQLFAISNDLNKQTIQTIALEKEKIKLAQLNERAKIAESQATIQQTRAQQNLTNENRKASKATKELTVNEAQLIDERRKQTAYTKALAQVRNTEVGTLANLEARTKAYEMRLARLTPEQIENTKTGQRYLNQLINVRGELQKQQAAYGKHTMNVGNYKSAYDGLGNSISQLAREMPAFGNSIQTGFMAISNNLPIFFDEIQKIKKANIELAQSGQPTVNIFKQIAGAIASPMMALNAFTILLTVAGPALFKWIGSLDFSSESTKRLREEIKKKTEAQKYANEQAKRSAEFIGQESAHLVGQLEALKSTNYQSSERKRIIKEINDQYGTTLKNMSDEAAFQQQINNLIFDYIEYQRQKFRIQRNEEKINANLAKQEKMIGSIKTNLGLSQEQIDKISKNKGWSSLYQQLTGIVTNSQSIAEATGLSDKEAQKLLKTYQKLGEQDKKNAEYNDIELEKRSGMWQNLKISAGIAEEEFMVPFEKMAEGTQRTVDAAIIGISDANDRLVQYGFEIADASTKTGEFDKKTKKSTESLKEFNVELSKFDTILANINNYNTEFELRFDIQMISKDMNLQTLDGIIERMKNQMLEDVAKTGLLYTDELDNLINNEYDIRKNAIEQQAQFEKDSLRNKLDQESAIRLRDLEAEKAEKKKEIDENEAQLIREGKMTVAQRREINRARIELEKQYQNERKKISDDITQQERLNAIEVEKIDAKLNQDLAANQDERVDKLNSINDELIDAQQKYVDQSNELAQKELEKKQKKEKEAKDYRSRLIQQELEELKKASEAREKLIDKEIDASQKLSQSLQDQANQGTITAQQSLAQQNAITNQRIIAKQKEERLQRNLEDLKILYTATEQYMEKGDTLPVAAGKAFVEVKGLKLLAGTLQGFYDGTTRTVGEELGAPLLPGKDGHVIRVDGSEMIFNGNQTRAVNGATTDEVVNGYLLSQMIGRINTGSINQTNQVYNDKVVDQLKSLERTIMNKPETVVDAERISDTLWSITTTQKTLSKTIVNRYIKHV